MAHQSFMSKLCGSNMNITITKYILPEGIISVNDIRHVSAMGFGIWQLCSTQLPLLKVSTTSRGGIPSVWNVAAHERGDGVGEWERRGVACVKRMVLLGSCLLSQEASTWRARGSPPNVCLRFLQIIKCKPLSSSSNISYYYQSVMENINSWQASYE